MIIIYNWFLNQILFFFRSIEPYIANINAISLYLSHYVSKLSRSLQILRTADSNAATTKPQSHNSSKSPGSENSDTFSEDVFLGVRAAFIFIVVNSGSTTVPKGAFRRARTVPFVLAHVTYYIALCTPGALDKQ